MDKTAVRLVSAFETIDELVFCGLMLTLPFGWQLSIVPNILFLVLMFRKAILESHRPDKKKLLYFAPMFAFLAFGLISLFYSEELGRGGDVLFKRLNLFVLPLVFLFVDFQTSLAKRGVRFFVLGSMLAALISLIIAFSSSILVKDQMLCIAPIFNSAVSPILDSDIQNNHFYGVDLSFFMHPAYFGLMLSIAMIGLLNSYVKEAKSWIIQFGGIPGIFLMSLTLVLLSTNGVNLTLALLVVFILIFASRHKQRLDMFSSWLVVFSILIATGLFFNPQLKMVMNQTDVSSISKRQKAVDASFELIKDHPFSGVGIGDVDTELAKVYKKMGHLEHAESRLNPHNQFLQTYAASGILGFLALAWIFLTLFIHGIKNRSMFVLGVALFTLVGFAFESMLNRYWGVLLFALFYSVLYSFPIASTEEEEA